LCFVNFIAGTIHSAVRTLSNSLSCVSGEIPNNCSSVYTSLTTRICSSFQQKKLHSSVAKRYFYHPYPFHNHISKRNCNSRTINKKHCNLVELLKCHAKCLYKHQPFPRQPVLPNIFEANFNPGTPAFAYCCGMKRSSRADVERIFGKMNSLASEDDDTDMIYTADEVEQFDERKKMAKELDTMICPK